jgi:hypothetical protein
LIIYSLLLIHFMSYHLILMNEINRSLFYSHSLYSFHLNFYSLVILLNDIMFHLYPNSIDLYLLFNSHILRKHQYFFKEVYQLSYFLNFFTFFTKLLFIIIFNEICFRLIIKFLYSQILNNLYLHKFLIK